MSRITLISYFDNEELKKVFNIIGNVEFKMCKVPYGINDAKRYEIDNLPYHFTIFATSKKNENYILNISNNLNIGKIKLRVNAVKVKIAKNNSYVLYLGIEQSNKIKKLQKFFYDKINEENYNPNKFTFHMTLHIDTNKIFINNLYDLINKNFKPFYIEFNKVALYNYPGDIIKIINI